MQGSRSPVFLRSLSTILLLLLSTIVLSGEEPTFRVAVPAVADPLEQRYNEVVADTVTLSLRQIGFESAAPGAPVTMEVRVETAPYPPRLHMSISAYDTASNTLVAGVNGSGRTNVTLLNSIDQLLEALESDLETYKAYLAEPSNPYVPIAEIRELRFVSRDRGDVAVTVTNGPRLLTAPPESTVMEDYRISLGSEVILQYDAPYAESRTETIQIDDPNQEIVIPALARQERFSGQLHYAIGKMVGFGFGGRWYPLPDRGYVALESDLFLSGVAVEAPSQIFHNEYRLLLGFRPGSPEQRFRFSFSTGAGVLLSIPLVGTASAFVDPYFSILNLGFEARIARFRPFIRGSVNYVLDGDFSLLREGVGNEFFSPTAMAGLRYTW